MPGLKRKQNTWWWNKQGYFQDAQGNWVREQAQGDGVDDPNAAYGPAPAAADASNPYDANGGLKDSLKTPIQGVFFGFMLLKWLLGNSYSRSLLFFKWPKQKHVVCFS